MSECVFRIANPPAPYSIQKCPEPQISPKLVLRIVFRDSNQGDPNLSKSVENKKSVWNYRFQFFDKYLTNLCPPSWNPKRQILDKFAVRGIFVCCKGREGSQF